MKIACFGSLNYDLSIWLDHVPVADETVIADRAEGFLGGKGANQATAAARLGAEVSMIGRVGDDAAADALRAGLDRNGVDHRHVAATAGSSGSAFPLITPANVSIIVVPGANAATGPDDADAAGAVIASADVLMLQGEVGADGAVRAAQIARANGTQVQFNPAPADAGMAAAVLPLASLVVLNEQEQAAIDVPAGIDCVLTLGARGARVGDTEVVAFPADVVDPTGAGDAFCGALAVALAEGRELVEATRFASAAGALAVGVAGAEPSMPTRAAVEALLAG